MPSSFRSANKAIPRPTPGQAAAPPFAAALAESASIKSGNGVFPTDAIEAAVRQEFIDRRAQRDPFVSQEFVASVNTGRGLDAEKWRDRRARDDRLQQQTEALAAALARTGIPVRRNAEVMAIGLITGARELLNAYRPICFFPTVAQRDRRPMLNDFRHFQRTHRKHRKWMRLAVVTAGDLIPLGGLPLAKQSSSQPKRDDFTSVLRERISELSRRISRFAQWALEAHDVDVVFRGTEFTVKQRHGDNFLSVHLHANVLYTPNRLLNQTEWQAFLVGAKAHFGNWWQDCGKLENPNEAIKYPFKPNELDPQRIGDAGVRWLYEQTFGLPMMQPMGSFRRWRNEMFWTDEVDAAGKLRRRKYRRVVTVEYASGARSQICSVRKRIHKSRHRPKVVGADRAAPENVLLGYTMPQRRFSPYAEPCALIQNYTPHSLSESTQETLTAIDAERRRVLPVWHMNGAPDPAIALALGHGQAAARQGEAGDVVPFIVHTRRITAGPRSSRGPPTRIRATEADQWQQLGVDFSVDMSVFDDVATATAG